jgi:hypothetical protein
MTIYHSSADIILQALVDNGDVRLPNAGGSWPGFLNDVPDAADDLCVGIFDSAGMVEGKLMSGSMVDHPGVQIRVRSVFHPQGWEKIQAIADFLLAMVQTSVTINDVGGTPRNYMVLNVSPTSNILRLGPEEGSKKRVQFAFNTNVSVQ